ncbi:hypothetical protein [Streptomyces sp. AA4]|nr:hypothetical protein [Streptomyces sp. AA4]EFL08850.1 predicted protein [Streptomyces sp. AA4]
MDARKIAMAGAVVAAAVLVGFAPAAAAILLRQPTVQAAQQQARPDDLASVQPEALLFESALNLTDRQFENILNDLGAETDD